MRPAISTTSLTARVFTMASLALVAGGLAIDDARAQEALGSGNALDRNPAVGSGGVNTRQPANPFAGRNAIITGEVVGGREFRGRVGYTAPGDFRGASGADDLYRFRANSAWSSPAVITLGGGSYDQLRFGQGLGVFELQRNSAGATPTEVLQQPTPSSFNNIAQSRLRYDSVAISSLTSSRMQTAADPTTLALARATDGETVAFSASAVRGLLLEKYNPEWSALGLTEYDQMRAREELTAPPKAKPLPGEQGGLEPVTREQRPGEAGATPSRKDAATDPSRDQRVGATFQTRFDNLRAEERQETSVAAEQRVDATVQTDYAQVLQRIVDRYARPDNTEATVDPAILQKMQEQYDRLRDELANSKAPGAPKTDASGAPITTRTPGSVESSTSPGGRRPDQSPAVRDPLQEPLPDNDDLNRRRPGDEAPLTPDRDPLKDVGTPTPEGEEPTPIDISEIGAALRHGQKVERLTSDAQGRFNELMQAAEALLRKGEYMAAEERFQRALRFSPGNPMAMAGAANAQIGAGFYLSASMALRSLFTDHPEMIDVTYAEGLFPDATRVGAALEALRRGMESQEDRAARALLLAYVGHQTADRAVVEEGLKIMEQEAADDPLPPVLRTIWLAEAGADKPAAPTAPAPRPATPQK